MQDARLILALLEMPKIGRKTAKRMIDLHGMPTSLEDLQCAAAGFPGLPAYSSVQWNTALSRADEIIETEATYEHKILIYGSSEFPSHLAETTDSPLILFVKGEAELLRRENMIAIIGTREPTDYGYRCGERFGVRAAESGFVVVSGLAKGCDAAAHDGCLKVGNGKTIAVMAQGLDKVYPAENRGLANDIIAQGGCWVSEYPTKTKAQRSYFVERDRIQAGLSAAVIVIETDVDGGTMHTVGYAQEYGRMLAALSHPAEMQDFPTSRGNQKIIVELHGQALAHGNDLEDFLSRVKERIAMQGESRSRVT